MTFNFKNHLKKPKNTTILDYLFFLIIGSLLSFSIIWTTLDVTLIERSVFEIFIPIITTMAFFGLVFSFKLGILLFCVTGLLVTGMVVGALFFDYFQMPLLLSFLSTFQGAFAYATGNQGVTYIYEQVIIWSFSAVISLFLAVFAYALFHVLLVAIFSSSFFIFLVVFEEDPLNLTFLLFLFCLLAFSLKSFSNRVALFSNKKKLMSLKLFIPIGFSILALGVASLLPTVNHHDGFDFQDFEHVVSRFSDVLTNVFDFSNTSGQFNLQEVGFSDTSARLGGNAHLNDRIFMRVETSAPRPHYLTGLTRDTYTGDRWINSTTAEREVNFDQVSDVLPLLEQVLWVDFFQLGHISEMILNDPIEEGLQASDFQGRQFINKRTQDDFFIFERPISFSPESLNMRLSQTHIEMVEGSLRTMFFKGHVVDITGDENQRISRINEGAFRSNRTLNRGSQYQFASFAANQDIAQQVQDKNVGLFTEISKAFDVFYQQFALALTPNVIVFEDLEISVENLITQYLLPRAIDINTRYTQLPPYLPSRIEELAKDITASSFSDREKLDRLERFLRNNFEYTLTPGDTPIDRDFVDHFLFDLKQGYCVHFASSFVVMARTLGFPARYVEGFRVSSPAGHVGQIDVLNSMAHAWAEVYFEGFGWIRFEPTPAASARINQEAPHHTPPLGEPDAELEVEVEEITSPEDDVHVTEPESPIEDVAVEDNQLLEYETESDETNDQTVFSTDNPLSIRAVLFSFATLIFGFISYLFRRYKKRQKRFLFDPKYECTYEAKRLSYLLSSLNHPRLTHQSLPEFVNTVAFSLDEKTTDFEHVIKAAKVLERGRFSQQELTKAERQSVKKARVVVKEALKNKLPYWRYWLILIKDVL